MKILVISNSTLQASMTVDYLKSCGVDAFSNGSREYASIITGRDQGRYEIQVPEDQLESAENHLNDLKKKWESHALTSVVEDDGPQGPTSNTLSIALKKAYIYGVAGLLIFPIFSVLSLYFLYRYLSNPGNILVKIVMTTVLLAINLIFPYLLYLANLSLLNPFFKYLF